MTAQVRDQVNWPNFLARHDLIWNRMPQKWEEGAFTGNGQLGTMTFQGDEPNTLRWHIGRSDVATYDGFRIPIGDLVLHPVGQIQETHLRLDLWNAELTGTLKTSAGQIDFRSLTSSSQAVQLIELTPRSGEANCTWQWKPGLAVNFRLIDHKMPLTDKDKNPPPNLKTENGTNVSLQPLNESGAHATAWREVPTKDSDMPHRWILLAVGYSKTGPEAAVSEAMGELDQAEKTGMDALVNAHRSWWHSYYPESFVSIPDTRLESFYWIQMYKFASGTRPNRPALDLMGPWDRMTPWAKFWWNLNVQLTYWAQLTSNRLELGQSLYDLLDSNKASLIANASPILDAAAMGGTSTYDCVAPLGGGQICNLPWALHDLYLQYRYTMDESMLKDHIFPLLKLSTNFYLHFTQIGPDGKLHIITGYSPEYPDQPRPNPDCNIDLALLRWSCQTLLQTCERDKIDDPLIPKWKETLAQLTPYPVDENGLMISPSVSFTKSHRHYSHLLMIFPLHLMDPDDPQYHDLVVKSLNHWMDLKSGLQGFSYTGASAISTLMGKGDDAAMYLNKLLDTKIHPNTMYTEAGPCMETPLSGAAAINDMLLLSRNDRVYVFPAIPQTWPDVAFENLRSEGAFLVSASRKQGATQFVKITSLAGVSGQFVCGFIHPLDDKGKAVAMDSQGTITLNLSKGESIVIHEQGITPDFTIRPVPAQLGRQSFYGLH